MYLWMLHIILASCTRVALLADYMKSMLIAGFLMGTTQMPRHGGCWLAQAC
jgi:hypothetical protein